MDVDEMYKSVWCNCSVLVLLFNPIVFFYLLVAVDVMVDDDDVDNDDDNDDDDSDGNGDDNDGCDEEWFDFCSY